MAGIIRRVSRYIRYDLREIVVPSSLPDPPGEPKAQSRSWKECWQLVQKGAVEYRDSWRRRESEDEADPDAEPDADYAYKEQQKMLKEDMAFVARGGAEHVRPYLQRLYAMRVATLQAAGQHFVDGYKEGLERARADAVIDKLSESFWSKSQRDKNGQKSA